jgi:hypothetical protein
MTIGCGARRQRLSGGLFVFRGQCLRAVAFFNNWEGKGSCGLMRAA